MGVVLYAGYCGGLLKTFIFNLFAAVSLQFLCGLLSFYWCFNQNQVMVLSSSWKQLVSTVRLLHVWCFRFVLEPGLFSIILFSEDPLSAVFCSMIKFYIVRDRVYGGWSQVTFAAFTLHQISIFAGICSMVCVLEQDSCSFGVADDDYLCCQFCSMWYFEDRAHVHRRC